MIDSQFLKLHLGEMTADQVRHARAGFNLAKAQNQKIESAAAELVAWFTSGNSIAVDLRHTVKVNGDLIMADAERLNRALDDRSIHEHDRSTSDVYPMM